MQREIEVSALDECVFSGEEVFMRPYMARLSNEILSVSLVQYEQADLH